MMHIAACFCVLMVIGNETLQWFVMLNWFEVGGYLILAIVFCVAVSFFHSLLLGGLVLAKLVLQISYF